MVGLVLSLFKKEQQEKTEGNNIERKLIKAREKGTIVDVRTTAEFAESL